MTHTSTPENSSPRPGGNDAPRIVAWVRDDDGKVVPAFSMRDGKGLLTAGFGGRDGWHHLQDRATKAVRDGHENEGEPAHVMMRDCTTINETFGDRLHNIAPKAAAYMDAYVRGDYKGKPDLLRRADRAFADELEKGVRAFFAGGRVDADSVFLHLETVYTMQRVLERRYKSPTVFDNAFPVTTFGTTFDTYRQVIEEYTASLARVGGRDVMASPLSSVKRNEVSRNLVPVDMSGHVDWWELRQIEEVRRNSPGPAGNWDLLRKRLRAAERGIQLRIGQLAAFGDDTKGIPGILGPEESTKIPRQEVDFLNASSEVVYNELNALVEAQYGAVGEDEDLQADSIALPPGVFMRLSHKQYSANYPKGVIPLFMENNPQIRAVYQLRELAQDSVEKSQLKKHKMSDAKAERLAGGIKVGNAVRSAVLVYRKDAELVEMVYGHDLMTITHAPNNGRQVTQLITSFGGIVAYEPSSLRLGYSKAP
jgi:hypothetical protein